MLLVYNKVLINAIERDLLEDLEDSFQDPFATDTSEMTLSDLNLLINKDGGLVIEMDYFSMNWVYSITEPDIFIKIYPVLKDIKKIEFVLMCLNTIMFNQEKLLLQYIFDNEKSVLVLEKLLSELRVIIIYGDDLFEWLEKIEKRIEILKLGELDV